jgi:hypothetical protein
MKNVLPTETSKPTNGLLYETFWVALALDFTITWETEGYTRQQRTGRILTFVQG